MRTELPKTTTKAASRSESFGAGTENQFRQLIRLACLYFHVKTAFVSLASGGGQKVKAGQGLKPDEIEQVSCLANLVFQQGEPVTIPDTRLHSLFRSSSLLSSQPDIRFCAGIPIRDPVGLKVGTLCLIDTKTRRFSNHDLEVLHTFASLVEDELEAGNHSRLDTRTVESRLLTRSISNAQTIFLSTDDDHAAFEALLDDLLTLTESAFGFIGEVLENEVAEPYVKVRAITNISWNRETAKLYEEVDRRGMVFDRLDTLIGAAVLKREVIISDDVRTDPRRGGTPLGHPPIRTYIGIPVFSGAHLVGLIGLANRPNGFSTQFAEELEPLTRTVGTLIERKRLYAERLQQHQQTERVASFDMLTGLPNRRLFIKRFDELRTQADRQADRKPCLLSVCFIDLDGFKEINDQFGHETGDAVLKAIALRLSDVLGAGDVVARLSGDEFVAVLQDVSDPGVYQRILEAIRTPVSYCGQHIQVSGSMGITVYPEDNAERDVLLRHADQAMYTAKELGKNRLCFFDVGEHQLRRKRHRIADDFRRALAKDELELFYQPKVDLCRQRVVGFEALIRWHHPDNGLLTPDQFLPALAGTEQEIMLGEYVIAEGVRTIERFARLNEDYSLSINISAQHILNEGFLPKLESRLALLPAGLRSRLFIEVLESMALEDIDLSINILEGCKRLGVNLSLDDFGTGFSSLSYFRRLPVDEIKIDKSFVREILTDADDSMIVRNIVNLAKGFNRRVVGEGVESQAVAEELAGFGCDLAQGYHFSRPLSLGQALSWSDRFNGC
ncbi:MAG: hypothetical protein CL583_18310 [Alteromonadaceae bacterium]|nr:hypothetical protein [Alteromonadaceae bacterium]|tara:strand:- start:292 stop:2646 length:2355 start_codon:yes stop_codon:yes gene_type:complete